MRTAISPTAGGIGCRPPLVNQFQRRAVRLRCADSDCAVFWPCSKGGVGMGLFSQMRNLRLGLILASWFPPSRNRISVTIWSWPLSGRNSSLVTTSQTHTVLSQPAVANRRPSRLKPPRTTAKVCHFSTTSDPDSSFNRRPSSRDRSWAICRKSTTSTVEISKAVCQTAGFPGQEEFACFLLHDLFCGLSSALPAAPSLAPLPESPGRRPKRSWNEPYAAIGQPEPVMVVMSVTTGFDDFDRSFHHSL